MRFSLRLACACCASIGSVAFWAAPAAKAGSVTDYYEIDSKASNGGYIVGSFTYTTDSMPVSPTNPAPLTDFTLTDTGGTYEDTDLTSLASLDFDGAELDGTVSFFNVFLPIGISIQATFGPNTSGPSNAGYEAFIIYDPFPIGGNSATGLVSYASTPFDPAAAATPLPKSAASGLSLLALLGLGGAWKLRRNWAALA